MYEKHFVNSRVDAKWGEKTFANWSKDPNGTIVVFVHGFGGSAASTWAKYPELCEVHFEFAACDLIFYDYDGLTTQASNSAITFYKFLNALFSDPLSIINYSVPPSGVRTNSFHVNKIVLVAHSLGAVVCRRALLDAKRSNNTWIEKTSMILFAPAHRGARKDLVMFEDALAGLKIVVKIGKAVCAAVDSVYPDSIILQSLVAETNKYLALGDGEFTKAKRVLWAEHELVVVNDHFCGDPMPDPIDGTNHFSVCKPRESFLRPLKEVTKLL